MTTDRALTIVVIVWVIFVALYLFVIVPAGEAAPIWGTDDMVCGIWTYYAAGVAERVQAYRGLDCPDCVGLAITVDRAQLGRRIDIRHAGQWVGPFLVVDVGTGTHRAGLVGEVGNRTAVAWGIPGPWRTCYREAA